MPAVHWRSTDALTWKAALARQPGSSMSGGFAGHSDWRVPRQEELRSP